MVRAPAGGAPAEVWTGSTNMSQGGISGQTNVGHWVRNAGRGGRASPPTGSSWRPIPARARRREDVATKKNAAYRAAVGRRRRWSPTDRGRPRERPPSSARGRGDAVLDALRRAASTRPRTRPRSPSPSASGDVFKEPLRDNTQQSPLVFILLEKKDVPDPEQQDAVRGDQRVEQRLQGVGLLHPGPGLPVGARDERAAARPEPARELHPLEVHADRPARPRSDRGHGVRQLQRGVDRRTTTRT